MTFVQNTFGREKMTCDPDIPLFTTAVDQVDVSVEVCGLKFENPFGWFCDSSNNKITESYVSYYAIQ